MITNKAFDNIEFHDLPVEKIAFDRFNQNLKINISIFEEFVGSYFSKHIDFQEVKMIHFDKILLTKCADLEIYQFDYEWKNHTFYGKMTLLLGFGKPSATIEFECKKIHVSTSF